MLKCDPFKSWMECAVCLAFLLPYARWNCFVFIFMIMPAVFVHSIMRCIESLINMAPIQPYISDVLCVCLKALLCSLSAWPWLICPKMTAVCIEELKLWLKRETSKLNPTQMWGGLGGTSLNYGKSTANYMFWLLLDISILRKHERFSNRTWRYII